MESYKKRFDANKVTVIKDGGHPYIVRQGNNNGQKGFIDEDESFLNEGNTISFGQDTATVFYQEYPYFTGDKIKILKSKNNFFNKRNAQFFIAQIGRAFSEFSWGSSSYDVETIKAQRIFLPVKDGAIDFDFMERFIAKLEVARIKELESEHKKELEAYLEATGLKDYKLTAEEESALGGDNRAFRTFNLYNLFGSSTRGKRLKSADRIPGALPFVTAGEADEGISDFIGNDVAIFSRNTTTIDMFGSAKYRNYEYGGDDHIAVVHTEDVPKLASIYITAAIHRASHDGQFSYSRNFYAKDADALDVQLPARGNEPDYDYMATVISAVQKLVIRDVVLYSEKKIAAAKEVVQSH